MTYPLMVKILCGISYRMETGFPKTFFGRTIVVSDSNAKEPAPPRVVQVCLLPSEDLPLVDIWLVVDIVRASTVVVTFFDQGGRLIVPVETVEEARSLHKELGGDWLLMGERNALPPEGFDVGNSPRELLGGIPARYAGAVMTTSNGTKAWLRAFDQGRPVLCASARNASAVVEEAMKRAESIGIICAGKDGRAAMDDTTCAGLLVSEILERSPNSLLDDGARIASSLWSFFSADLSKGVKSASHMKELFRLGLEPDVDFCSERDRSRVVPEMTFFEGRPAFVRGKGKTGTDKKRRAAIEPPCEG